jgi:hypothetical protein
MKRWLALLLVLACSGPAEPEPPAPAAPERAELDAALTKDGEDTCRRACDRLASCPSAEAARFCLDDCDMLLAAGHAAPALRYSACLEVMSCEEIQRAVHLAVGPIGRCFVAAERMGR